MNFLSNKSNNFQGIFFVILSCFFASLLVVIVRHLSKDFHILFIIMVRNFFGFLCFLPHIITDYKGILKTKKPHIHILRGINGFISMIVWFTALTRMPLSEAVSISFIVPIITIAAAALLLKEKVKTHNWIGSFVGFFGVLIILQPGFKTFNPAYYYSFAAVILWVITNLLVKIATKTEKPKTIVAYMSLIMFVCSVPFAIPYFKIPDLNSLFFFILLGLVSNLTHICMSSSYSRCDLATVQPFDFTRLVFTAIISYFAFGEVIDFWVIIGSLVILFAVIIVTPRRKKGVINPVSID